VRNFFRFLKRKSPIFSKTVKQNLTVCAFLCSRKLIKKKEVDMGFFTCILILIVLYCPWLIGVIFVVAVLAMIFSASPVLFFLLLGGAVILMVTFAVNILIDSTNEQEEIRRKRQQRKLEKKKLKEKHGKNA
ncbi:MAG: hypothetical protein IKW19_05315, partial [Akkermansia sp.]|nr:hypothetical protein [Akkermansia sp.]